MALRFPEVVGLRSEPAVVTWNEDVAILYALAVGFGSGGQQDKELRFVYEPGLSALPTLVATLARRFYPDFSLLGIDYASTVHLAQMTQFHAPVHPRGRVLGQGEVAAVHDLGPTRGAVIVNRVRLNDADSGALIATVTASLLARSDGGFGGPAPAVRRDVTPPDREADRTVRYVVAANQALLYRRLGELNPLHADPEAARARGFTGPILHGLCTYGIACRAVLETCGAWDAESLVSHELRFLAPVYPGDVLSFRLWLHGEIVVHAATAEKSQRMVCVGTSRLRAAPFPSAAIALDCLGDNAD
jgi:acyl dehydratase